MRSKFIGAVILLVIVAAALYYQYHPVSKPAVTLKGLVGGEKIGLLEDEAFKKILKGKYGITLDYSKAGSIEMVKENAVGYDFLFPSSQTALELFKSAKSNQLVKSANIFNSPIVLYTWDIVADALIKNGLVTQKGSTYVGDLPKLVDAVMSDRKWADIGLSDLYGNIAIIPTDPTKSNSGNMFSGLMANALNGEVVDETTVANVLPQLKQFFKKLGYLEPSSGDLFEQYLRTGVGAKPIIVGYENQIIEFADAYPDAWKTVKNKIRIIYPAPTVWSAHPLIVLTPKAKELISALEDKEIQKIAWEKHGFRTGLLGVQNDQKVLTVTGIPESIAKVMPMPKADVMELIIEALQTNVNSLK